MVIQVRRFPTRGNGTDSASSNSNPGLEERQSDIHWEAAADAIRANILATLQWEFHNGRWEQEQSHRLICDGYRGLVFEDKTRFDGATIAQVREHFKDFVDNEPGALGNRFRSCLIIDEGALKSFIRYPEPTATEEIGTWVTFIEPKYEPVTQYEGYMRIHLSRLCRLACLGDVVPMSEMCTISEGIACYNDFWKSTIQNGLMWFECTLFIYILLGPSDVKTYKALWAPIFIPINLIKL
ncbi:hypothetical protein N7517_001960 [Penicillium concentricum]|uniref:Uncharacterized protein n=1 Tax=Penicillium concentricum TaxID=293559 RepID=A0A9W9SUZ6_9EURO|nr:uncharacterized protein N7517_001960 [Penicillium concentricum]KAJ5384049.1 hypothetical protein N7517_001960 [Penicillium concentricum]